MDINTNAAADNAADLERFHKRLRKNATALMHSRAHRAIALVEGHERLFAFALDATLRKIDLHSNRPSGTVSAVTLDPLDDPQRLSRLQPRAYDLTLVAGKEIVASVMAGSLRGCGPMPEPAERIKTRWQREQHEQVVAAWEDRVARFRQITSAPFSAMRVDGYGDELPEAESRKSAVVLLFRWESGGAMPEAGAMPAGAEELVAEMREEFCRGELEGWESVVRKRAHAERQARLKAKRAAAEVR